MITTNIKKEVINFIFFSLLPAREGMLLKELQKIINIFTRENYDSEIVEYFDFHLEDFISDNIKETVEVKKPQDNKFWVKLHLCSLAMKYKFTKR
jgi:hypothetical protein